MSRLKELRELEAKLSKAWIQVKREREAVERLVGLAAILESQKVQRPSTALKGFGINKLTKGVK